jgi:type I restriction enzyme S subunit
MTADSAPMLAKGFHGKFESPIVQLGDVVTLHYGKALAAPVRRPGNIPVYGSNGQCGWHDVPLRQGPTVVLGRKGQGPLGVKWCPGPFWVIDTAYYVTIDPARIDLRYFYYLTGYIGLNHLKDGTSNPSLSRDVFVRQAVPLPDLPAQRKIAGILSAYDDLIENNLRRIKILEEMAQSLYREWFVHFRFPGHESARFIDSPLGRIPQGWDVKAMTEAVTVRPKVSIPKGGDIPFVTMGGLSENSMLITEVESRDTPTGARFQNGDTLFARITPCLENGKTGYVEFLPSDESAACGSTEFIVLRSKTVCPQYVYLMARSDAFRDNAIKSMSGATGRQRVRDECFDQFFLAQPSKDLLARFEAITRHQFELIHSLNRRNQNLRRTRDLLLSKLLSR